ncbi:MAG: CHASE domain-containing protein [Alphaproteobacteria bacterium]|nr:CHASE domain-containing protein [Alphaproteobacteria bacterium]
MKDFVKQIASKAALFYLPPLLVFVVGMYLTWCSIYYINAYHRFEKGTLFANDASLRVDKVKEAVLNHVAVISQFRNYFISANSIDHQEFSSFAAPILEKYPGIKRIEWIPRVLDHERPIYEAESPFTERDTSGKLSHANSRKEYFPIYYVEPMEWEQEVAGYDLGSDANLRKALFLIAKTGKNFAVPVVPMQTSKELKLKTPANTLSSELHIFAPIYLNQDEERESQFIETNEGPAIILVQGFVRVVLDVKQIVNSTLFPLYPRHIDISIEDLAANKPSSLVYYYSRQSSTPVPDIAQLYQDSKQMLYADIIHVLGRTWQITCISYDPVYSPHTRRHDWFVLSVGVGLTLSVCAYLCLLTHAYRKKLTRP